MKTPTLQKRKRKAAIDIDKCHLYGIKSIHALAIRVGFSLDKLPYYTSESKYRVFPHPKTKRIIQEPPAHIQHIHRQVHKFLSRVSVPDYLYSTVKGRSYISNAAAHLHAPRLVKIDVKKFYPSVRRTWVMKFFRDVLCCASDVSRIMSDIICFKGALATGSAASPIIAYYACKKMFDEIHRLALSEGLTMTCYVDDITFSGDNATKEFLHRVRVIINRHNLIAHKSRIYGLSSPDRTVTGTMLTKHGLALPKARWTKIWKLEKELQGCTDLAQRYELLRSLTSSLYEAAQIDPACRKMAEAYHQKLREAVVVT